MKEGGRKRKDKRLKREERNGRETGKDREREKGKEKGKKWERERGVSVERRKRKKDEGRKE